MLISTRDYLGLDPGVVDALGSMSKDANGNYVQLLSACGHVGKCGIDPDACI